MPSTPYNNILWFRLCLKFPALPIYLIIRLNVQYDRKGVNPACRGSWGNLNEGHLDSNTETENGILTAITGLGPTCTITGRTGGLEVIQPHIITVPTRKAGSRLFIRRLLIHVLVVSPPV
ncbi:hypothetical protein AVEN_201150-1 [Araneus ventricosus]|uniref:Uncharacterized protein n=1 Tax=Araneus ventricosus TaxID=182803 RepID=A0A4Y2FI68_ARAVE|nr:hypothetical protein AVEN_201150-1 [Araneus ventricosus]